MVAPTIKDDSETVDETETPSFASERAQFGAAGGDAAVLDDMETDPSVSAENSPETDASAPEADVDEPEEKEPDVATVSLSDDDFADATGGLFSGVEGDDEDDEDEDEDEKPSASDADDSPDSADPSGGAGAVMAGGGLSTTINEGFARLAVVGLDGEYKIGADGDTDCLEGEFRDVFASFRLGHFGAEVAEEYLLTPGEEVNPAWALLGAACVSTAFAIQMRPDGDEIIGKAKAKFADRKPGVVTDGGRDVAAPAVDESSDRSSGPTWTTGDALLLGAGATSEVEA